MSTLESSSTCSSSFFIEYPTRTYYPGKKSRGAPWMREGWEAPGLKIGSWYRSWPEHILQMGDFFTKYVVV
jgi:hypothetical protein